MSTNPAPHPRTASEWAKQVADLQASLLDMKGRVRALKEASESMRLSMGMSMDFFDGHANP